MIELKPANSKLSRRMKRIVSIAAGVDGRPRRSSWRWPMGISGSRW